jgi:hypothetical protein
MPERRPLLRTLVLVMLLLAVSGTVGCRGLKRFGRAGGRYFKYRAEDFAEIVDLGITFTKKPTLSLYGSLASIWCIGYSRINGHMLGMGGGQVGWISLSTRCYGAAYTGHESVMWGKKGRWRQYDHPMGLDAILGAPRLPPPAYCPACTHYLHLLWVGVVLNLKYAEFLDFILGFTTFDLARDDGQTMGRWFFQ